MENRISQYEDRDNEGKDRPREPKPNEGKDRPKEPQPNEGKDRPREPQPNEGKDRPKEPQPIGAILAELFVQYQARFPEVHIAVVETPAAAI